MNAYRTPQQYSEEIERKELVTAFVLYYIGAVVFLHRIYLGSYKPTLMVLCACLGIYAASIYLPGSRLLGGLMLVTALVWLALIFIDLCRMETLVDRANAQLLEKFK